MSMTTFAKVIGASYTTISRWENGHAHPSGTQHEVIEALIDSVKKASDRELREISKRLAPGLRSVLVRALLKR